jgi:hypothetical protein
MPIRSFKKFDLSPFQIRDLENNLLNTVKLMRSEIINEGKDLKMTNKFLFLKV